MLTLGWFLASFAGRTAIAVPLTGLGVGFVTTLAFRSRAEIANVTW
jgi:hypothetical protein